jgi:hypothetical protein
VDTESTGDMDLIAAVPPTDGDWDLGGGFGPEGLDTGDWDMTCQLADTDPGHPHGDSAYPPGSMVVQTPHGTGLVGAATEDSNNDGRLDTAITPVNDGILLITDVDGDGSADQIVKLDNSGAVTVSDHVDHERWIVAQASQLDQSGRPVPAPGSPAVGTDDSDWVFDEVTQPAPEQDTGDSDSVWV